MDFVYECTHTQHIRRLAQYAGTDLFEKKGSKICSMLIQCLDYGRDVSEFNQWLVEKCNNSMMTIKGKLFTYNVFPEKLYRQTFHSHQRGITYLKNSKYIAGFILSAPSKKYIQDDRFVREGCIYKFSGNKLEKADSSECYSQHYQNQYCGQLRRLDMPVPSENVVLEQSKKPWLWIIVYNDMIEILGFYKVKKIHNVYGGILIKDKEYVRELVVSLKKC